MAMNIVTPGTKAPQFTPAAAPDRSSGAPLRNNVQPRPPTHEEIARCAYDVYIAHGRTEGRRELDWHQAEQELAHGARAAADAAAVAASTLPAADANPNQRAPDR